MTYSPETLDSILVAQESGNRTIGAQPSEPSASSSQSSQQISVFGTTPQIGQNPVPIVSAISPSPNPTGCANCQARNSGVPSNQNRQQPLPLPENRGFNVFQASSGIISGSAPGPGPIHHGVASIPPPMQSNLQPILGPFAGGQPIPQGAPNGFYGPPPIYQRPPPNAPIFNGMQANFGGQYIPNRPFMQGPPPVHIPGPNPHPAANIVHPIPNANQNPHDLGRPIQSNVSYAPQPPPFHPPRPQPFHGVVPPLVPVRASVLTPGNQQPAPPKPIENDLATQLGFMSIDPQRDANSVSSELPPRLILELYEEMVRLARQISPETSPFETTLNIIRQVLQKHGLCNPLDWRLSIRTHSRKYPSLCRKRGR